MTGFNNALEKAMGWAVQGCVISEKMIPTLHALMIGDGQSKITPSAYRSDAIVDQMKTLVDWINVNSGSIPPHIIAEYAYYQCLKIEPFMEGNENFAKLLSTIIQQVNKPTEKKDLMRSLDTRQRKALKLFKDYATISASQIGEQFKLKPRTRAQVCKNWVAAGFLEIVDFSNKARKYKLTKEFEELLK